MKKARLSALAVAVGVLVVALSCEMKRASLGSWDKIIIIADSTQWQQVEPNVLAELERIVYTPQPEPVFSLMHNSPAELGSLTRFPSLLILGTLDAEGEMKNVLDRVLTAESRARIAADSAFLFSKEDAWARKQLLVMAIAKDIPSLKENLRKYGDRIFELFERNTTKRVFESLYVYVEQEEIEKKLMEEHGWSVRVQHDYHVAVDSAAIGLVWLRRFDPQRWLSVYWEPVTDPSLLTKDWLLEKRAQVIEKIYDGDYVYQDSTIKVIEKEVEFNNRPALRLDGVWQNEKHVMGGPFRMYGFYNESDGRLYLIDLAVYAPGEKKYQYMRQLEGIASTFKTRDER